MNQDEWIPEEEISGKGSGQSTDSDWLEKLAMAIEDGDERVLKNEKAVRLLRSFALDVQVRDAERAKAATLEERVDHALCSLVDGWADVPMGSTWATVAATWLLSRRVKEAGNRSLAGGALGGIGSLIGLAKGFSGLPDTAGIPKEPGFGGFDSKTDE